MTGLESLLVDLGVGVGANALYDHLKSYFQGNPTPTEDEVYKEVAAFLKVEGADIKAKKIVSFMAENGDIQIHNSKIDAEEGVKMFSSKNNYLDFGDGSKSQTKKSIVTVDEGMFIRATGGMGMVQDDEGNVKFYYKG